jgi:hypothetical protein
MNSIDLSECGKFVELWHNGQRICLHVLGKDANIHSAVAWLREHIRQRGGDNHPRLGQSLIAKMGEGLLSWDFDGRGQWEAASAIQDDGGSPVYRIGVCDDGTFDVSESDDDLLAGRKIPCFQTLLAAKDWCAGNEVIMMNEQLITSLVGLT